MIFTSGTSGVPRGIIVEPRNILAFPSSQDSLVSSQRRSSFPLVAFDAPIVEMFGRPVDVSACTLLTRVPYNAIFQTPGALPLLLEADPLFTYQLICGGNKLTSQLAAQIADTYKAGNGYGPTKASIQCTKLRLARQPLESLLGNKELTRARFPPDPYDGAGNPATRMYRTGELRRFCADGEIEYQSQINGQVELFGLLIKTGKVKVVILDDPDLPSCTVVKVEQGDAHWLFAFVCIAKRLLDIVFADTAGWEKTSDPSQLWMAIHSSEESQAWLLRKEETKTRIALKLLEHMVLHWIVPVETMPRTASGKTDM